MDVARPCRDRAEPEPQTQPPADAVEDAEAHDTQVSDALYLISEIQSSGD